MDESVHVQVISLDSIYTELIFTLLFRVFSVVECSLERVHRLLNGPKTLSLIKIFARVREYSATRNR